MLGLQEQAPSGTNSLRGDHDSSSPDSDVDFWGEAISPAAWSMHMPSIPNMPAIPNMPSMRNMPSMPSMPALPRPSMADVYVGMPTMPAMPTMPNGWAIPNMPAMAMPTMPVGISPMSGWGNQGFFGAVGRRKGKEGVGGTGQEGDGADVGDGEEGNDGDGEEDSDDEMTWDDEGEEEEEEGDVDEMELFGHR